MNRSFFAILFVFVFLFSGLQTGLAHEDENLNYPVITLKEALEKAQNNNPKLNAARQRIAIAEGELKQAGLYPNPEVGFEVEKIGGNGQYAGTGVMETTFEVSQEIVTANKLRKSSRVAKLDKQIAQHEAELQSLALKLEATKKYIEILSIFEILEIENEYLNLSERNAEAVRKKVQAGEIPLIDETRAMVELASVQTSHKKLIRELETARYELASLWGETTTEFNLETPEISNINLDSEFYSDCKNRISEHPELKIANNKVAKAKAQSILAKAQATGNFEFAMGVQKSREDNKHNYFAGISIPLQIFDRNQGNISASKARVKEEENSIRQSELDLTTRLIELQKQLQSISEECENASATLLPGAKLAFSQMKKAYDQGERELFELFDAHRILLEARKVSARLEAEQLALYAEMCLITNQQALLLNVFGHEMTEIENER